MYSQRFYPGTRNSTALIFDRQYGNIDSIVCHRLQTCKPYIERLELELILEGHNGCVNCLEWSDTGQVLASGSDDQEVILWDVFRKRKIACLHTPHKGNIFSVKFLPKTNNNLIVSGAADKSIFVFDLNRRNNEVPIWSCQCHWSRVKRLATAPDIPFNFWSAGEDGNILQFDIREPHRCKSDDKVVLINLSRQISNNAEAKCIAVNPRRPELIAVGANDAFARLYDRRMLRLDSVEIGSRRVRDLNSANGNASSIDQQANQSLKNCVTYFCPGQYYNNNPKLHGRDIKAITYLTFNQYGNELLVNMGAEHIYLYDINNPVDPIFLNLPDYKTSSLGINETTMSGGIEDQITIVKRKLPENVESFKKMGNDYLENEKYLRAIDQYSEAIEIAPFCPILYLNRATALMRRSWYGDVYAAIRDCHKALNLDPSYIKAHFRLARALFFLGKTKEADECLTELIKRFPSYESNHGVMMLKKEINERISNNGNNGSTIVGGNNGNGSNGNSNSSTGGNVGNGSESDSDFLPLDINDFEWNCRINAKDYQQRFVGHCNTTTDIKEANFFGDDYIVAGSDDGNFFIWERPNNIIKSVFKADMAIVNCVQPHPNICLLATSGIDQEIKIWSPVANTLENKSVNRVQYIDSVVDSNQQKMKTDPFDLNTNSSFCRSS
ncbi:WD and tetratricopeptide repeats protein 1 [Condylostylus longicornis]|uniref:WD and tetratricopeptide repeats protein 1 n=1 Tax=Condylostylus longicornis TaxID=2530218 RepID=UPI00244DEA1F|nr:WD and tetratricopeptide repeats protein 1 [Condylostylus longicornis]XP_055378899.1 WD and tetratricopeptide repeats protein 1 [Condylostylus longicornis]